LGVKVEEESVERSEDDTSSVIVEGSTTPLPVSSPAPVPPAASKKPLSKKEKELLRKREMEEFDAILSDMTVQPAASAAAVSIPAPVVIAEESKDASKRKNKSKSSSTATDSVPSSVTSSIPTTPVPTSPTPPSVKTPAEIAALLKQKQLAAQKSTVSSSKSIQQLVANELKDGKKDKKKTNKEH